ncbi:MAG: DUF4124 domain-containing protein [Proteobacteria bacterium]|jgi:hypothetical protein|nr:DUF4124 domain-containing protein [Pseudomonadota bacterium]
MPLNHYILAFFLFALTLTVTAGAEQIYKWIDKNGTVHFSDQPGPQQDSQTVTLQPGPTPQQVEEARQADEKIRQSGNTLAEQNAKLNAQRKEEAARRRQEAAAAEQQQKLEEYYQQPAQGSGWYYGWPGIHPRPPRPRPPIKPKPPMRPVPTPLPARPAVPR